MRWTVRLTREAAREVEAMPDDVQARFRRIATLIEAIGLEHVSEPHVRHVEGKLWEMRASGRDGIARALYFSATGRVAVVVRAFVKKTQKTPRSEIELALKRMREWRDEQEG